MAVEVRAVIEADDMTVVQRQRLADVALAAEALVVLGPTDYQAQDDGLAVLREAWERLEQSLPGATAVFAVRDVDARQTG